MSGTPTSVPPSTSSVCSSVAAVATASARSEGVASAGTSSGMSTCTLHALGPSDCIVSCVVSSGAGL